MIGAAAADRHHRGGRVRAQPASEIRERGGVALQLIFNAIRGFGGLLIHDSFHRTANSAEIL